MTDESSNRRPAVIARVASHVRRCASGRSLGGGGRRDFKPGAMVRARARVSNDGTYPHRDIGEILVAENDLGCVRESWSFLGELYYTIEFVDRALVVIMRAQEIVSAARKVAGRSATSRISDDRSILLVG